MAIKGKSKPRGGSKGPARGPKPAYVPVNRPFLQRKAFWVTVVAVLGIAVVGALWYGIAKQRTADREEALAQDLASAVTEYQGAIEPILAPVGQPVPPSGFEAFGGFGAALTGYLEGTTEPSDLEASAASVAELAGSAAKDIGAIEGVTLVAGKGFDETVVLYVVNSQSRLVQAMQLYEQGALLAQEAAAAPKAQATPLAERASQVVAIATDVFADGYQDYVELQIRGGIYQPQIGTP